MLDSWNQSIFADIKTRLQGSAVKLVQAERNGEVFDSQLVIGVRESYGTCILLLLLRGNSCMPLFISILAILLFI